MSNTPEASVILARRLAQDKRASAAAVDSIGSENAAWRADQCSAARRRPENTAYENAAILVLGLLLAATIAIYQLRGWAGV
jgi:hypothetical protein